jgi:hypothetical protein
MDSNYRSRLKRPMGGPGGSIRYSTIVLVICGSFIFVSGWAMAEQ